MSVIMKCDCCGKIFGENGYIDHVTNFSENAVYLSKLDADEAIEEIALDYNDEIRNKYDIKERLKCFCVQKSVPKKVKEECKRRIENYLKFDEEQRKIAKEKAESLTNCERYYLCKELMINHQAPIDYMSIRKAMGYED